MILRIVTLLVLLTQSQEEKLKDFAKLKEAFNKSKGRARMLVILAPC